ncbi:MAG: 30S ribosomal protein S12 methylthiotransferase RimO [Sinobacteraceae bacterium]|nr:30S ribosomal protein S12 methylthiotransferase RimO [Nevskiaceae bacterium]
MSKPQANARPRKVAAAPRANPKIGFVSLGCPKALVDSERILTQLRAEGYETVPSYEQADAVVVNTCGFIDAAVEESLAAIGEALAENGKVIVTGCLGAGPKSHVVRERFTQLLSISGPQDYASVMEAVHRAVPPAHDPFFDLIPPQGIKLTPRHYAYLKIAEGCNHQCRFCIIPSMRGRLASRPLDEVMDEAERLVRAGVQELLIIAQDTSAYGADLKYARRSWRGREYQTRLLDLCRALSELSTRDGRRPWIRLHYVYPYPHVDALVELMAEGRLLPYLDVPFQHGSPAVLQRMRRPAAAEDTLKRLERWRALCPDISVRSTFIVGFPGETEAEFQQLLDWLDAAQLDRVGCFKYSPVEGAAANALPDPVPEEIKEERYARFMEKQAAISANKLQAKVGKTLEVLIDEITPEGIVGRSFADAPEIDGKVYLRGGSSWRAGQRVRALIQRADTHDLYGRIVE